MQINCADYKALLYHIALGLNAGLYFYTYILIPTWRTKND